MMTTTTAVKVVETQAISPDADKCCCSWTGGKDCNLALLTAWRDPSLHVTCLVVFKPENKPFDAHPLDLMRAQSASLGLPLHEMELSSSKSYKDAYVDAIRWLRDEHGIAVIATGDMDLVGGMATNWIADCGKIVGGVRAYLPLWKAPRAECLNKLVEEDFTVLFSCVKEPWFDASWCGRVIDKEAIEEMTIMSEEDPTATRLSGGDDGDGDVDGVVDVETVLHPKDPRRLPLDLGGEQGEYHTMCLDGPLYARSIELVEVGPPKRFVSGPAEDGQERWWTYEGQQWWTFGEYSVAKDSHCIEGTAP